MARSRVRVPPGIRLASNEGENMDDIFIDSDPELDKKWRKVQARYDTRVDKIRRPRIALGVAAIVIVLIIIYGLYEYLDFFFDVTGSKYD